MKTLYFYDQEFSPEISLSIFNAEILYNAHATYNSVGKLVRYIDENPSPYLAKSWVAKDNKWIFNLHDKLKCENGEIVTPSGYKKSLLRILKWQSQKFDPPIFSKLMGFETFKRGSDDIIGIEAQDSQNQITFEFSERIRSGILEYLAMSPFGYLCEDNFIGNDWANDKKLISSGPYKAEFQGQAILLSKRQDWLLNNNIGPDKVILTSNVNKVKDWERTITLGSQPPLVTNETSIKVIGIPIGTTAMVIQKGRSGFFSDKNNRQRFYATVRSFQREQKFESIDMLSEKNLYPTQSFDVDAVLSTWNESIELIPKTPLVVRAWLSPKSDWQKYIVSLIQASFAKLNWPYEIHEIERGKYNDMVAKDYDIRVTYSEVGTSVQAWINDMLFGSEIGPQYPDPEGKILQITKDFNLGKSSYSEFVKNFNETLTEQASFIPILSNRYIWNVGLKIKDNTFSPLTSIPSYDLIGLE